MKQILVVLMLLVSAMPVAAADENYTTAFHNYNKTDAFKSINGMRDNFSWTYDPANYPAIEKMTNFTATDNDTEMTGQMIAATAAPFTDYWASPDALGAWFYVVIIVFTVGVVYIKTKQLESVSITLLMLSMIGIAPVASGMTVIPLEVQLILYTMTALSIAGVLYSAFARR